MIKETKKTEPISLENKETNPPIMDWRQECRPRFGEHLARNMAIAALLVLAVTSVRNAQLPSGKTVLAAVQEIIDPKWTEQLGKINFVSNLLPETIAVFFESDDNIPLLAPCFGTVSHSWSSAEPYVGYTSKDTNVYAAASGQVMSVAHGPDEEYIVRIRHENGVETLYYNLADVAVLEGDSVSASTCLGHAMQGTQALLEVRRAGRAVDPSSLLSPRTAP